MFKIILFVCSGVMIAATAFALTPQEASNKQNEAAVNILLAQYQNDKTNESTVQTVVSNYKDILNLNGINWTGMDWNNPQAVNWTKY